MRTGKNKNQDRAAYYKNLPDTPGVYLMKDGHGNVLYVGKAGNLKRRVSSYFLRPPSLAKASEGRYDSRIEELVRKIQKIDYKKTGTAIEALMLEARLIKQYLPPFNIREKDDTSFLYVEITKEKFPRVLLVRGKTKCAGTRYGPFTSASSVREALKILRRIFPWNTHPSRDIGRGTPCFDAQIDLCPELCVNAGQRSEYLKTVRNLKLFFEGKKERIIKNLKREMRTAAKDLEFEKAERIKRNLFALQHIQDVALIKEPEIKNFKLKIKNYRIEGFDISNLSGTSAVGSMAVFEDRKPAKRWYRRFKIRTLKTPNDVGMLKEIMRRRFVHDDRDGWPLPDLVLVDGGAEQVRAAREVLRETKLKIPVVGIAKGPERKRNDFFGAIPGFADEATLIRVRDEAHRFAIAYHKKVRAQSFLTRRESSR